MGNLFVDPLAIAALAGFAVLILVCVVIALWVMAKARSAPSPAVSEKTSDAPADTPAP